MAETEQRKQPETQKPASPHERWEVVKEIGRGGQGQTFLVKDLTGGLEGLFVMKRLHSEKEQAHKRFTKEVEALFKVKHPGVAQIVHVGTWPGKGKKKDQPFYVMPYMPNGDLTDFVMRKRGDLREILMCFSGIVHAIEAAHEAGVIHRDIKPQNIVLNERWDPVVVDFGICFNFLDDTERFTEFDEVAGSRNYMAPELENGKLDDVTVRADIYSLGKLLWYMLSPGEKPYVFSREAWNTPKFDLVALHENTWYRYVNEMILAKSVQLSPADRFERIAPMSIAVAEVIRLMDKNIEPLSVRGMECKFCGQGYYEPAVDAAVDGSRGITAVQNFGFNPTGGRWRILVCTECGHCEFFRFDLRRAPGSKVW